MNFQIRAAITFPYIMKGIFFLFGVCRDFFVVHFSLSGVFAHVVVCYFILVCSCHNVSLIQFFTFRVFVLFSFGLLLVV